MSARIDAALTDAQIRAGWKETFSTENPFCPCDLKTFTKAVRWAERTVRAATGAEAAAPARDREADRARYSDADFNEWLDDIVADGGCTVWHLVNDVHSAAQGWDARPYYGKTAAPAGSEDVCTSCDGSGESTVLSGGGPDAYDVPCNCPKCGGTGATAAPAAQPEAATDGKEDVTHQAFESWWLSHGQFCRAGGGDYEKSFAFAAWSAALAIPEVAQPEAAAAPAGWRLVPVEPTAEMEQAAADYLGACVKSHGLWGAMLAAAPTAPAAQAEPVPADRAELAAECHKLANELAEWADHVHSRVAGATADLHAAIDRLAGAPAPAQGEREAAQEMRLSLIVQIHNLIDIAERQSRRMHKMGDTDERDYIDGAIAHARKVSAPYNYNGPYRAALAAQPAAQIDAWRSAVDEALNEHNIDISGPEEAPAQAVKRLVEWVSQIAAQPAAAPEPVAIRCKARLDNGGVCPHHNLHCGWPACNNGSAS